MAENINPRAGKLALESELIDVENVLHAYYTQIPDINDPAQKVVFGTSGHRGNALKSAFNETHILAITQSICDYRSNLGIQGPLFIGFDTHLLSIPAFKTALEVLVANGVDVRIDSHVTAELLETALSGKPSRGLSIWTPTPAISHAILKANTHNGTLQFLDESNPAANANLADGIVVTPSHNPPTDGGFKYNPPHGGPADSSATKVIAARANEIISKILSGELAEVKRVKFADALDRALQNTYDFRKAYVADLKNVIDMDAIREAGVRIGADPLGGAAVDYWSEIAKVYGLDLQVVNPEVDPKFSFMTLDWDGKIRMDCSSPYSMQGVVEGVGSSGKFDIMTGNDADSDRHGIVTADAADNADSAMRAPDNTDGSVKPGLMNPNHYLAVAISYLFGGARPNWPATAKIGKTLVSSSLIDRVAAGINRELSEVPVGFKWFVDGLIDGSFGFGGEESAGASFLKFDGTVWTTDKDGIILGLLASEIFAKTGKTPAAIHRELTAKYGVSYYARIDAAATLEQKDKLSKLSAADVAASELADEPIIAKLTEAPGNGASIGGLKVVTENAWFAARPSGTENVYKIYAESFVSLDHLALVQAEAKKLVDGVIA